MARTGRWLLVAAGCVAMMALDVGCIIQPLDADCPAELDADGCARCQQHSGCGWCDSAGCMPGTSVGPDTTGACPPNDWYFNDCRDPAPYCNDSCATSEDGTCDEPRLCDPGTDCTDCREE